MLERDPLDNPRPLIRRVYAYAAYRLGPGADAEDATSDAFERALRYRSSYDARRGDPAAWLIGIARRCVDEAFGARVSTIAEPPEIPAPGDLETETLRRVELDAALTALEDRDRELIALRYGADLTARQIAELMDLKTNAVEVALHRALGRLRRQLQVEEPAEVAPALALRNASVEA